MDEPAAEGDQGRGGSPRLVRTGRTLWWSGTVVFVVNLVFWSGEWIDVVPHAYPELPIAIACMLAMWTGRACVTLGRQPPVTPS